MNPNTTDLLATLAQNRWRLDCRHEVPEWRCMYFCGPCHLWKCVVETGQWYPNPSEAIQAAVDYRTKENT